VTLVLGLSGFFGTTDRDLVPDLPRGLYHDAAACLVGPDGVLAAVEEERINRVKHTNLFPARAARACLEQAGVRLADVTEVAYFFTEANTDLELSTQYVRHPDRPIRWARELITDHLSREFRTALAPERIRFARHHEAHAASAFFQSGLAEALVAVMDGEGDDESVSIFRGTPDGLRLIRSHPKQVSLGHFYRTATQLLGYGLFDEYKVMGLAPYGDPASFRNVVGALVRLLPEGRYELDVGGFQRALLGYGFEPRRAGEPFGQQHRDLAASVQETLQRVVLHLLEYWRGTSGLPALCLAGGVAQNSSMNGRLVASGLFDEVFVHPASHDAGAALGAAMLVHRRPPARSWRLHDVYWGPDLGDADAINARLTRWHQFLDWQRCADPAETAAELLATGAVIGWAQGRSEFGPRALGNRSILADPRPADNWRRVNQLVKQREGYRPLAPAVLAEAAADWFDLPRTRCSLDYMGIVVGVRPDHRDRLGAVTHVDGTARIQVVRRATNDRFWRLIARFGELTGVPVVLNTSFNNHVEPIVQSGEDAIVCFLTTGLEHLVIGDFLVSKRPTGTADYLELAPGLAPYTGLAEVRVAGRVRSCHLLHRRQPDAKPTPISAAGYQVLARADGQASVGNLLDAAEDADQVVEELRALWAGRLITLIPGW